MRNAVLLLLSLALHFLLWTSLSLVQVQESSRFDSSQTLIELVDSPKEREQNAGIFTRQVDVPDSLLKERKPDEKARFLSEHEQTVLQETRAADTGLTENRRSPPEPSTRRSAKLKPDFNPLKPPPLAESGTDGFETSQDEASQESSLQFPVIAGLRGEAGRSTFAELAPSDLKVGEMTALNTDRFLYYSFYERAQRLIYRHWAKYVRAVLYSYGKSGAATGDEYWITRIEIVLDREGRFRRGLLHQGSGLTALDVAPVNAFRDAQQIPHPPDEMVQADGTVRMHWEFAVRMMPQLARER